MENLELYESFRKVPEEAKKEIQAGRLKGKTDINPMWRIKALTERFGPCGIGWKYVIQDKHLERSAGPETAAFVDIDLYFKQDGEWSEPIPGTGGSMFVAAEKNGPYTSDECYKMALTDAISVACKALGIGADVYWGQDATKYNRTPPGSKTPPVPQAQAAPVCEKCGAPITAELGKDGKTIPALNVASIRKKRDGQALCSACAEDREWDRA